MLYQCWLLFPLYSNCIPIVTISHHVDFGDLGPFGVWFMALFYPHYLPMISPCCTPILIQNYIPILYSHDLPILSSHYNYITSCYTHMIFPWYSHSTHSPTVSTPIQRTGHAPPLLRLLLRKSQILTLWSSLAVASTVPRGWKSTAMTWRSFTVVSLMAGDPYSRYSLVNSPKTMGNHYSYSRKINYFYGHLKNKPC